MLQGTGTWHCRIAMSNTTDLPNQPEYMGEKSLTPSVIMSFTLSISAEAEASYSANGMDNLFKSGHAAIEGLKDRCRGSSRGGYQFRLPIEVLPRLGADVRFAARIFPKSIESLFQARYVFFSLF